MEGEGGEDFSGMRGARRDTRHRWRKFIGQRVHATCPYDGYRLSVVFFTLPASGRVSLVLRSLGFRAPTSERPLPTPFGAPPAYRISICSARRAQGLVRDPLPALFADGFPHRWSRCVCATVKAGLATATCPSTCSWVRTQTLDFRRNVAPA